MVAHRRRSCLSPSCPTPRTCGYMTAWLKANWPLLYMTCLINSESIMGNKDYGYNLDFALAYGRTRGGGEYTLHEDANASCFARAFAAPLADTLRLSPSVHIRHQHHRGISSLKLLHYLIEFIHQIIGQFQLFHMRVLSLKNFG
jgi:hypothetical protein